MDANNIMQAVDTEIFGIWYLIGAALVFFMQAGFAMVETGFTRAKNAGNIIMKNLMDFCIGTVVFALLGFGLMMGEDVLGGFCGMPTLGVFTDYAHFGWSPFVFNLVFCATAATIVSGAMAERTKFLSYCIYSGVISLVIYPIEAHWVWGGGWLVQLGFHDFAGSCAIHMVGGVCAIIGAAMVGPRIGKFDKDKKPKAIPGHSLTLGALGCFILWFGWYGFNGAAATSGGQLGSIFVTTTIAPAVATVVCMIFTWLRYGKPDVSMCLNASLAGLVGVTAGCDVVDALGSAIIGIVSGLLVIFGVWFLDNVLKIDDPVGAVAVHFCNGVWGTLAVGLLANPEVPGYALANANGDTLAGLFYGGGFELLGLQALGFVTVAAWTAACITVTFLIIKKTIGLRVNRHEEVVGLDATEHGLQSSYADFIPSMHIETTASGKEKEVANVIPVVSEDKAVPVAHRKAENTASDVKMTKVDIITSMEKFDQLKSALYAIGITGMTVTNTMGCGMMKGKTEYYRGIPVTPQLLPKVKVEVVVCKVPVVDVVSAAKNALYTVNVGDGKIFVYDVEDVMKIRTGESGYDALQDNA
ncbi:MAG: ammonium transporter [Ruminiclostridium sp.]|nr:ammonium transporter [Ruminiclostridium sp.]